MAIRLPQETEERVPASIKRFFAETLEQEIGDLKASLFLDFALKEMGPVLYNRGVADAGTWLGHRLADLENSCAEPEIGYWKD